MLEDPLNRRSASRHAVSIPARLFIEGESDDEAIICNLSLGGAQLLFERRLGMGQQVRLVFSVPGHPDPIEVGTTVRWASDGNLGLQFAGLRAREVWALNRYLASLGERAMAADSAGT